MMKKILFAVMAMLAVGFTSCNNKAKAPADGAETEVTINAEDEAAATINALTEQMEAKDANKFQEVLASVKEKVLDIIGKNPEAAKEYVTKVQEFLKENADKIKEFVGDNEAVNSAVSALTEAPAEAIVSGFTSAVEGISNAGETVKDAASDAVDAAADKAKKGLDI
jgi:murein L,D-transpeptidase YcbB/YkuD